MAVQLVTCKKCKKVFDYESTDGICPRCARFYSKTTYNEEEAFLTNILSSSNEANCSYHSADSHIGHNEGLHKADSHANNNLANANKKNNTAAGIIIFIIIILSAIFSSFE